MYQALFPPPREPGYEANTCKCRQCRVAARVIGMDEDDIIIDESESGEGEGYSASGRESGLPTNHAIHIHTIMVTMTT